MPVADDQSQAVARVTLVNFDTFEESLALFNPRQLEESVGVDLSELTVPGLNHKPIQYTSTGNRALSVDFFLDQWATTNDILDFRRFLEALTGPGGRDVGEPRGAPPSLLFAWPGTRSMLCLVGGLKFSYKEFFNDGSPRVYTASVSVKELRKTRLFSESLRQEAVLKSEAEVASVIDFFRG